MVDDVNRFAKQIYALREIVRYNNVPKLHHESVAEHTAFVVILTSELQKVYKFDVGKAVQMALSHDFAEIYLTDIPYNIKKDNKALLDEYNKLEDTVMKTKFGMYYNLYTELQELKTPEALVVKLADVLSVIQYSYTETELGNTGYMLDVLKEARVRRDDLLAELEKYKK